MPKKIGLIFCWFFATFILLLSSSLFLYTKSHSINFRQPEPVVAEELETRNLEGNVLGIQIYDKRPFVVSNFLKKTPMEKYSSYIVEVADKYGIDYRFIPAIAMKESGGGRVIVNNSFNAWGFENGRTKWGSWEEAIDAVGKTLKFRYINKGMDTPDLMMPVYAPPAMENGGGWARAINGYFEQMQGFEKSI